MSVGSSLNDRASRTPSGPPPPDDRATGAGIGEFVALLSRRVMIWAPIFGIVLAIAVYSYVRSPVYYRSATKVLVDRGERENALTSRKRYLEWEEELSSEVQAIISEPVLARAEGILEEREVRYPNGDPINIAAGQISASPVRESNVLEILYQNRYPDVAQAGAAAITDAYVEFRRTSRSAPEVEDFFRSRIQTVEAELGDLGAERRNLLREGGLANVPEQRVELVKLVTRVRTSLLQVREEVAAIEARGEALQRFRETGQWDAAYLPFVAVDLARARVGLEQLATVLVALLNEENELSSRYQPDHPLVIQKRNQIEGHRLIIEQASNSYQEFMNGEAEVARAREAELLAELAVLERELGAYPDQEQRLSRVDREIRALEGNYEQLVSGYAASDIQNASAPSWNVRIFAVASDPFRFHTGDLIRTLVVPLFALVVGFGLAFIVDALDPSVKTAREAERIFEAPVIASVARIGRK